MAQFKVAGSRSIDHPHRWCPTGSLREEPLLEGEYPQLAVALGGASPALPEIGPEVWVYGGGIQHPTYVAGNLHVKGT